jgi:hypothetical protein
MGTIEDIAASLYDGGWRSEDETDISLEYGLDPETTKEICWYLRQWEN